MQLKPFQLQLTKQLAAASIEDPAYDAKQLIQSVLQMDASQIIVYDDRSLSEQEQAECLALAGRRIAREPLSHLLEYKDFWKDRFLVSRDVLTPRADSETLIEAMLDAKKDHELNGRILDLGTGSGCLLLSLLREYPNAIGLGVDKSSEALAIATQNAERMGLESRAFFAISDWMDALQSHYDMIITNPPYIRHAEIEMLDPEVKDYEPLSALTGGDDGLHAYRHIMNQVPPLLKSDGVMVVELGLGQAQEVSMLAEKASLKVLEVRRDLAGIERALVVSK